VSRQRLSCTRRSRSCLVLSSVAIVAGSGSHASARLTVTPPSALVDTPLRIVVRGVRPHERVVFRASAVDLARRRYRSRLVVRADAYGVARAPMSLLSSMRPAGAGKAYIDVVPWKGERVTITAEGATASVRWLVRSRGVAERDLRPSTAGFYGDFFRRRGAAGPAVIVFGGSEGGLSVAEEAALLASRGFPTLGLAYFGEQGLPSGLSRIRLEYFARAARWLSAQAGGRPVVVYGISRGSEAALLLGVYYPHVVRAVVALVPGNVVLCGYPDCGGPAWTLRGKAVPFQDEFGPGGPHPIPVERIRGPLFLDRGEADAVWPSCPMARAIARRRRRSTILVAFPGAGHGVGDLVPNVPQSFTDLEGLTAQANADARRRGWSRLLAFLRSLE